MAHPYAACINLTADINKFSSSMAIVTSMLGGTLGQVNRIAKGIESWNPAIMGAAASIAGMGILKAVESVEKAGEKLRHAKVMFEAALPMQDRAASMAIIMAKAVDETGKNMRTTLSGNVELMHDLYNIVQDPRHAAALLGPANVLKNMLESVRGKIPEIAGAAEGAEIAKGVRALEMAGRVTTEQMAKSTEMLANSTIALRGRVTPGQLFTQVQNAGLAKRGWDDAFLTQGLPALMSMDLGNRAGTGLRQLFNNLYLGGGGALSSRQQSLGQEKWFLHTKEDENTESTSSRGSVHFGKLGSSSFGGGQDKFRGFKPGTVFDADTLAKNPVQWSTDYLHLKNKGVDITNDALMMRIIGEVAKNNMGLQNTLGSLLMAGPHRQLIKELINMAKVLPPRRWSMRRTRSRSMPQLQLSGRTSRKA